MWYRHVQWNDWLWAIEHSSKLIVSCCASSPARPNNGHDRHLWCTKRDGSIARAGYNISDVSCSYEVNGTACHLVVTYCVVSVRHTYKHIWLIWEVVVILFYPTFSHCAPSVFTCVKYCALLVKWLVLWMYIFTNGQTPFHYCTIVEYPGGKIPLHNKGRVWPHRLGYYGCDACALGYVVCMCTPAVGCTVKASWTWCPGSDHWWSDLPTKISPSGHGLGYLGEYSWFQTHHLG